MGPPSGLFLNIPLRGRLKSLVAKEFRDGDGVGGPVDFPQGVLDVGDDVS